MPSPGEVPNVSGIDRDSGGNSPIICHGLIQIVLEKGGALKHLQYIDGIIVWGDPTKEVYEKGKKIIQIILKAGFVIKQSKVKGFARQIHFFRDKLAGQTSSGPDEWHQQDQCSISTHQ